MKKVTTLLAMIASAMFPAVFLLLLVGAMHLLDGRQGIVVITTSMALPVGSWLIFRKMGRYE